MDRTRGRGEPLRILCAEPENYSAAGLAEMAAFGSVDARTLTQAEFARAAADYDVLMLRVRLELTPEILSSNRNPPLAVISPTTGVNHLALPTAEQLGVHVFHLRGEREFLGTIHSTAEHTFGLMLALVRHVVPAVTAVRAGKWVQEPFRGRELSGKSLGLVGFGRLGSIVARYGLAFDMKVATFDPYVANVATGVERVESLLELCRRSDVLSIHAPLNESTRGLVGRAELAVLPPGAFLVNTARGEIVDEAALLEALDDGRLAGAAVDVLAHEHEATRSGSAMLDYARAHDRLIVTPHVGGATYEAVERTDRFVIRKFASWLASTGGA